MADKANPGDATPNATSQGGITPLLPPKVHSTRKTWYCTWASEQCGNWAHSNGLKLCPTHQHQHEEEQQRLVADSCLAHIGNNDQLIDEVGPAENIDASAAENFDNHAAIVNEWLNDVNDAKINATAVETLRNQAIDN